MDCSGLSLTLHCGTRISFPIQSSSNFPVMLTKSMIHPKVKSKSNQQKQHPSSFVSFSTSCSIFQSLLNTATFPILQSILKSALLYLINALDLEQYNVCALPKFIDCNILSQKNPAQKELLLWHYHFGHADLGRIQCILCETHAKERDNKRRCIVTPCHKGSSVVDLVHKVCEACQLAKQKARHPLSKRCSIIDEKIN